MEVCRCGFGYSLTLKDFLTLLFAPALVSLAVSLWVNRRSEAWRARRDHITKLFEVTREDIRRSVEVAIDYFSTLPTDRSPLQEAKVLLAERELRSAMPIILDAHHELINSDRFTAKSRFEDLMAELTGGNFQEKSGSINLDHIRRLSYAGAGLRASLARMRDAELKILLNKDPMLTAKEWIYESIDWLLGHDSTKRR